MAFTLWPTVFVANVSRVTAAFLNHVRTSLASAIDGVGGGLYTPSAVVEINNAGLKSNNIGNSTVLGTLLLSGVVSLRTILTLGTGSGATVAARVPLRIDTTSCPANADASIRGTGAVNDIYVWTTGGSFTAARTITISVASAVAGEVVVIVSDHSDGTFTGAVESSDAPGVPIATMAVGAGGALGQSKVMAFRFTGTTWVFLLAIGDNVGP